MQWYQEEIQRLAQMPATAEARPKVVFFDYENWGVVEALRPELESGALQLYGVDSLDAGSLYCQDKYLAERVRRHLQYERYLLKEVLPLSEHRNPHACLPAAGCSMGAFHGVSIAFRYP